jgi:hypothetical protein
MTSRGRGGLRRLLSAVGCAIEQWFARLGTCYGGWNV